ncbi:predicted protein [Plenodomus lingam JN3]|uniref:Predicted protein n=1 Tax=Leptosphaeria maculans (strain JN3 / isolate v23.1.3 / race Av1-4-5-6-7-8) TaxID=985895 RepID=E5ACH7_LEPMJ|nr:predicted protein [Plenodomus lingam JN3]CBY02179.1 predicted protein [Plenodomus lingam JN3]
MFNSSSLVSNIITSTVSNLVIGKMGITVVLSHPATTQYNPQIRSALPDPVPILTATLSPASYTSHLGQGLTARTATRACAVALLA